MQSTEFRAQGLGICGVIITQSYLHVPFLVARAGYVAVQQDRAALNNLKWTPAQKRPTKTVPSGLHILKIFCLGGGEGGGGACKNYFI